MIDLAEPLNRSLYGFTDIVTLEILRDDFSRDYPTRNLRLVLENPKKERIELWCLEICEFRLQNAYQIHFLQARDVRSHHLDRVQLKFKDEEQGGSITFSCFSSEVKRLDA